jgi:hypothetical protein
MDEKLRLFRAVPGPSSLRPLVTRFARDGEGLITSLDDALLPVLKAEIDPDWEVEVAPFGALVRRALEAAGEEARPLATSDQYAAAIGQAASALDEGSDLRRAIRFQGVRSALVRTLTELGEWGYDLSSIAEAASGELGVRAKELCQLQAGAWDLLQEIGRDTHVRQLRACQDAITDPETRPTRLLVFVGEEAPPAKLDWLRWSAAHGTEVWVVVERHATDGEIFGAAASIIEQLGAQPEEIGTGNRLLNNLFSQDRHGGTGVSVSISSAADPLAECEWALRGCLELGGEHPTAIYVRSLDTYAPLLKASSERLGIPLRIQSRVPLLENAFARLSLQILEACASNDVRLFVPVLRSSYLSLTGSERARLRGALLDARARKTRQWEELASWLGGAEQKLGWLLEVLRWRETVMASPGSLGEWRQRLRDLVGQFPWHEALEQPAGYSAERDLRAFSAMHSSLETEAVLGRGRTSNLSLGEFARRCRAIWEAADVSVPADEGVPVVASALALGGARTVFVLGMLEGVFPRRRSEEPILSDRFREEISSLQPDRPALRTSKDVAAAERDEFYRVCAAATDSIRFTYPETGEDRDNIPAFYLDFVKVAVGEVSEISHPRAQLAPLPPDCVSANDLALRHALDADRRDPPLSELTSVVAAKEIHPGSNETFRPSALRDALQCPFRYQMRDRLRIPTKTRLSHWSRLHSVPQTAQLVKAHDVEEARRHLEQALEAQIDLLVSEAPDWELKLLRSGGNRLIREWLDREFRAREIWPRGDTIADVKLGDLGTRESLPGGRRLEGSVPAISTLKGKVKLLHLFSGRASENDELSDPERLYVGLYFGIGFESERETALEIEGSAGKRSLVVLSRAGIGSLRSDIQNGLQIIDLGKSDDPATCKKVFKKEFKELLDRALASIERGEIRPDPGDHCSFCDYGELCRRSIQFNDDDSPFGEDEALGAA